MRPHLSALLLTLFAATAGAQDRPLPPLVERVEVNLVNVEAIVTDRSGNRVTGLTKADFILYEDGRKRAITNFHEVIAPGTFTVTSPPDARPEQTADVVRGQPLRIAIFIDSRSLQPFSRQRVLDQVDGFLTSTMKDGDQAMLALWDRTLTVPVPLTEDRERMSLALDRVGLGIGPALEQSVGLLSEQRRAQDERDREQAAKQGIRFDPNDLDRDIRAMQVRFEVRRKTGALRAVLGRMAGLDGRKLLLLVTQAFPWCATDTFLCLPEDNLQALIDTVSEEANADGIAIYTLYAAPNPVFTASAEYAEIPSDAARSAPLVKDYLSISGLDTVARATGGLSTTGPELGTWFHEVAADLDGWYSLGYPAPREREGRTRAIRLEMKDPRYRVRVRSSVVEKSASRQLGDRLVSRLFDPEPPDDSLLQFEVKLGAAKRRSRGRSLIPADIIVPLKTLTLIQQGRRYRGGILIQLVTVDHRGDLSEVTERRQRLEIPARDLDTARQGDVTYSLELLVDQRGERVAVAVVDEVSGETGIQIVELPDR